MLLISPPPYEADEKHHGTSAALEFSIRHLNVDHLIILGHSQCGGIQTLLSSENLGENDFISHWMSIIKLKDSERTTEAAAKAALLQSYQHCLTFPWLKQRLQNKELSIHLWYFDIKSAGIDAYHFKKQVYLPLQQFKS